MVELKKLNINPPPVSAPTPTPIVTPPSQPKPERPWLFPLLLVVALLLGTGTGYLIYQLLPTTVSAPQRTTISEKGLKVGDVIGIQDEKTYRDSAEGVVEKGGLDGEGSHKLLRPGGPSQTAYLTSSVIDLDNFEGHKVQVWGETFTAQKAGWLMDVGQVKVLELNAEKP